MRYFNCLSRKMRGSFIFAPYMRTSSLLTHDFNNLTISPGLVYLNISRERDHGDLFKRFVSISFKDRRKIRHHVQFPIPSAGNDRHCKPSFLSIFHVMLILYLISVLTASRLHLAMLPQSVGQNPRISQPTPFG